jgi:hypothetical protein
MNKPELIIIDNFLPEKFLKDILNDNTFWESGYSWWGGWWQSPNNQSNRHKLIEYIYKEHCPFPIEIENGGVGHGVGFEHWVGITTPDVDMKEVWGQKWALAPHQDKDELYWENHPQGKNKGDHMNSIRTPMLGTVYYAKAPKSGGYLKVWDEYDFHKVDEHTPYELIKPKSNRLIIFNAGKVHAVEEVKEGTRKAVAINIWEIKPTTEMNESKE